MLGDSIVAQMCLGATFRGQLKIAPNDTASTKMINLAVAGYDMGQILSAWYGSVARGNSRTKAVFIQGSVNDTLHGQLSAAQILTFFATLIGDIQTTTPGATIYLTQMDPAHTFLDSVGADRYQRHLDVAAGLAATYPSIYHTDIHDALADANDDFKPEYGGPVLHPNTTGDAVAVGILQTFLLAQPGGWA